MIKITLNQIRARDPGPAGWAKVLKAQGGKNADFDKPFPLSSILDSNGLDDTLWVLRCLPEHDSLWRLYEVWCARNAAEDAWAAAGDVMREKQAAKLRQILDNGEWVDGGGQ
jgi:hypothetical protein